MQTASTTKDSEQAGSGGLNWRQRKKANMRRQQEMQRRRALIDGYIAALGGADRVSAIQMEDVHRCVDLVTLAAETRDAVRQGKAKVADMTRLEGAADRAVRRLNLRPPGSAAPVESITDYWASRHDRRDEEG